MNYLNQSIKARIAADIVMVAVIAWTPWWLIAAAALVLLFIYSSYYEIILWGIIVDVLYNPSSGTGPLAFIHGATAVGIALFFCMLFLKKRLAF